MGLVDGGALGDGRHQRVPRAIVRVGGGGKREGSTQLLVGLLLQPRRRRRRVVPGFRLAGSPPRTGRRGRRPAGPGPGRSGVLQALKPSAAPAASATTASDPDVHRGDRRAPPQASQRSADSSRNRLTARARSKTSQRSSSPLSTRARETGCRATMLSRRSDPSVALAKESMAETSSGSSIPPTPARSMAVEEDRDRWAGAAGPR